uniref:RING-type E3 ubiquitin transferase n=1 Tax=Gadus morhua TaxID=8049 RepID=A0A8C4ZK86_GADMO
MRDLPNPLVLFGIGSSFAFSGMFYNFYRAKKEELRKIKVWVDQHLLKLLTSDTLKRFQYIGVDGLVQPDGEPLASEFVPRSFGVVQKISEEEHWETWNSLTLTWDSQSPNRKETDHTVPFSLVAPGGPTTASGSDGDVYVKVQNPLEATGLDLDLVNCQGSCVIEGGLSAATPQDLSNLRFFHKSRTEAMLLVGTTVTGFGEVMRLQAPQDGRPYVLLRTDYKSYVERHENSASMWKKLAVGCGAIGTVCLAETLYDLLQKHNDKR